MIKYLQFIISLLITTLGFAQQATPSFWYEPKVGEEYYSYPIEGEITPGGSGTDQVWDFSQRQIKAGYRNKVYQDPRQLMSRYVEIGNIVPMSPSNWLPRQHYTVKPDTLIFTGIGRFREGLIYTDPQILFAKNPVPYNYTFKDIIQGYNFTDTGPSNYYKGKSTTEVDGLGRLLLPNKFSVDAIRVRIITTITDSNRYTNEKTTKAYNSYLWFKNGLNSYPLMQIDERIYPLGDIETSFIFNSIILTEITTGNDVTNYFNVFPTQTKDHLTCQYSLSQQSAVTITLLNSLGTAVQTLQPTTQMQGEHQEEYQLPSLPAGMYFVDININGTSNLKKIFIAE